jgi:hypothetical protein
VKVHHVIGFLALSAAAAVITAEDAAPPSSNPPTGMFRGDGSAERLEFVLGEDDTPAEKVP